MFARRYGLLVVFLLVPVKAYAHLHKAGVHGARSFASGSRLDGFTLGAELMKSKKAANALCNGRNVPKCTDRLSFFVYGSRNEGTHGAGDRRQLALAGGIRYTYAFPPLNQRFEVYGHGLGAFVRTKDTNPKIVDSTGAWGAGAGVTIRLFRVRPLDEMVARAQYDCYWLGTAGRPRQLWSAGLEYRFGRYH